MDIGHQQNLQVKEHKRYNTLDRIAFSNFKEIPWPCFVPPNSDELLTSWLTRVARSHLVRFYSFCSSNFDGCEFWNRDLDLHLPGPIRMKIIGKCALDDRTLDKLLLQSYYPNLTLVIEGPKAFWITPMNFYSNTRRHLNGISVCSSCLQNDGQNAYYRKAWRIALNTVCISCGKELIDRCPECGSPVNYIVGERGKKFQAPLFPITSCWKCLTSLSTAPSVNASEESIRIQTMLVNYLSTGYAQDRGILYSHLYFDVLKKIASLLNRPNAPALVKMQKLICKKTGLEFHKPLDNRLFPFNTAPIRTRRNLIEKAFWLLEDWPERFKKVTTDSGLKSKYFLEDFHEAPYWFKNEILTNNKLVYFEWRKSHRDFSYSSFKEMSMWQVSKAKNEKPVGRNIRKRNQKVKIARLK